MTIKSRSNRGWFHKLRWIHVKVDTKNEGRGSPGCANNGNKLRSESRRRLGQISTECPLNCDSEPLSR